MSNENSFNKNKLRTDDTVYGLIAFLINQGNKTSVSCFKYFDKTLLNLSMKDTKTVSEFEQHLSDLVQSGVPYAKNIPSSFDEIYAMFYRNLSVCSDIEKCLYVTLLNFTYH